MCYMKNTKGIYTTLLKKINLYLYLRQYNHIEKSQTAHHKK